MSFHDYKAQSKEMYAAKVRAYGGTVKSHPDLAQDKALIRDMVKPEALKRSEGGLVKGGKGKHARTEVAVLVAPHMGAPMGGGVLPMAAAAPGVALPPMAARPAPMLPAGAAPSAPAMMPAALAPRKRGGRTGR